MINIEGNCILSPKLHNTRARIKQRTTNQTPKSHCKYLSETINFSINIKTVDKTESQQQLTETSNQGFSQKDIHSKNKAMKKTAE
jgi:hypothetical protein